MSIRSVLCASGAALLIAEVAAAAPSVVVDIAPVHSIVARVMDGVGTPALIVAPGASPHGYAMRPSEAAMLQDADLVVWVGETLTPWLAEPLAALAPSSPRVTLLDAEGLVLLPTRDGGPFEAHVHEHAGAEAAEDHAGHDHAEAQDHADAHDHDHDHAAEGAIDAHVWLDPVNAATIAMRVAEALAEMDPGNATAYVANAGAFEGEMRDLAAELDASLAPLRNHGFLVFHDAYQYFEARFDLPASGSIALSEAEMPSAARVADLRARVTDTAVACIFAEPQFEPKLVATVIEGTSVRTGVLDPIGAALEPGAALYPALLRGLASDLTACLAARS